MWSSYATCTCSAWETRGSSSSTFPLPPCLPCSSWLAKSKTEPATVASEERRTAKFVAPLQFSVQARKSEDVIGSVNLKPGKNAYEEQHWWIPVKPNFWEKFWKKMEELFFSQSFSRYVGGFIIECICSHTQLSISVVTKHWLAFHNHFTLSDIKLKLISVVLFPENKIVRPALVGVW